MVDKKKINNTPLLSRVGAGSFIHGSGAGAISRNTTPDLVEIDDTPPRVYFRVDAGAGPWEVYTNTPFIEGFDLRTVASTTSGAPVILQLDSDGIVNGVFDIDSFPDLRYQPIANFVGSEYFKYTVTDQAYSERSATANFEIRVTPYPVSLYVEDSAFDLQDSAGLYPLLGIATPVEALVYRNISWELDSGDSPVIFTNPTSITPLFTLDSSWSGSSMRFALYADKGQPFEVKSTGNIDINYTLTAPPSVLSVYTNSPTSTQLDLTTSASISSNSDLTFVLDSDGIVNGTFVFNSGVVDYQPIANFVGTEYFEYTVADAYFSNIKKTIEVPINVTVYPIELSAQDSAFPITFNESFLEGSTFVSPVGGSYFGSTYHIPTTRLGATRIAIDGDNTLISEFGAAYLFSKSTGQLIHTFDNTALGVADPSDFFGSGVALSAKYIAIAGEMFPVGTSDRGGIVWVYDAVTKAQLYKIDNPNPGDTWVESIGNFGYDLAITGDYLVVGAPFDEGAGVVTNIGQVYIYDLTTGLLFRTLESPSLPAYGGNATFDGDNIWFGRAVDADGDNVIIGQRSRSEINDAWVMSISTGEVVAQLPAIYQYYAYDQSGRSVAISGNYAVVANEQWSAIVGKVAVYDVSTSTLLHTLVGHTSGKDMNYGCDVAIDGNNIIVGEYWYAPGTFNDDRIGRAYVYAADTGLLKEIIEHPTPIANGRFGQSVAVSGDNFIVTGGSTVYAFGFSYEYSALNPPIYSVLGEATPFEALNYRNISWELDSVSGLPDGGATNLTNVYLVDSYNLAGTFTSRGLGVAYFTLYADKGQPFEVKVSKTVTISNNVTLISAGEDQTVITSFQTVFLTPQWIGTIEGHNVLWEQISGEETVVINNENEVNASFIRPANNIRLGFRFTIDPGEAFAQSAEMTMFSIPTELNTINFSMADGVSGTYNSYLDFPAVTSTSYSIEHFFQPSEPVYDYRFSVNWSDPGTSRDDHIIGYNFYQNGVLIGTVQDDPPVLPASTGEAGNGPPVSIKQEDSADPYATYTIGTIYNRYGVVEESISDEFVSDTFPFEDAFIGGLFQDSDNAVVFGMGTTERTSFSDVRYATFVSDNSDFGNVLSFAAAATERTSFSDVRYSTFVSDNSDFGNVLSFGMGELSRSSFTSTRFTTIVL